MGKIEDFRNNLIRSRLSVKVETTGNLNKVYAFLRPYRPNSVIGQVLCRDGLIHNFQVHPNYRKHGIGKTLLYTVLNRVPIDKNEWRLYARAEPHGMPQDKLEQFYKSMGFKPTGSVTIQGKEMILKRNTTTATVLSI